MSVLAELANLADAAILEFGRTVMHTPTRHLPNRRPEADPDRPEYLMTAVFDHSAMGSKPREADLHINREKTALRIIQSQPVLSAPWCSFRYPPAQGDEFTIIGSGDRYRVLNAEPAMEGLVRCLLEQLGRPRP